MEFWPTGLLAMKVPRVEDFDPAAAARIPDMGMANLPAIERPVKATPPPPPVSREPSGSDVGSSRDTTTPRHRDTVIPRHHDTVTPRYRDTTIATIATLVTAFGKEAATYRFTQDEKNAIRGAVYSLRQKGQFVTENEILRVALNFIMLDFRQRGETSILAGVLRALKR